MNYPSSIFMQRQVWLYLFFGVALVLSSITMLAWLTGSSSILKINSSDAPMQFNTALSLFSISLAAISLNLQHYRLTVAMASFTLLLILVSLAQTVLDTNLGIDELFVSHKLTTETAAAGRIPLHAAICFVLSSLSLLWLAVKHTRSFGVTFVALALSLVLALSILSVLGYLFSIQTGFGWRNVNYLSLPIAIGFFSFSAGLLLYIAFERHSEKANVYYVPIVIGTCFLVVSLLFTNNLDNENKRAEDPILALKQALVADHVHLAWNNALLKITATVPSLLQAYQANALPEGFFALYLEQNDNQLALLVEGGSDAKESLNLANYSFSPAPDNTIASRLGVISSKIFLNNGSNQLLLKLPVDNRILLTYPKAKSLIVPVDINKFLQHSLAAILSEKDSIIFGTNGSQTIVSLPFYTDDYQLRIKFHTSEYRQAQNKVAYIVFGFALLITLAIVLSTYFAQHLVYQNRRLVKHTQELENHELELEQSHLTLKLATDVAQLGIWRWNVETDKLTWNERMFEIYDTPIEVIQSGLLFDYWYQTVHPEDRDQASNSLQEAVKNHQKWVQEFRLSLPNGKIKYIKATAIVFQSTEQSIFVIGGNIDITHERELQYQLEEKTKQAENDSLAKSQFLANMSHELRTPMNGVLGIGELLRATPLSSKQSQYIDTMLISAEKLLSLLNDILDLSKIEAGEMSLELLCIPFEEVVATCLKSLANSAHTKGLDYHYHKDQTIPDWVITDPIRLEQIIINIVSNAIKFTEEGEVTVKISNNTEKLSKDNTIMVCFEVCDSGIGLTAEQTKNIFTPFSQADESITRRYGGTGLGLSIVQQLISMLDGSIEVNSEVGKGTRVLFNIPMKVGFPEEAQSDLDPDFGFYQEHAPEALEAVNCLVIDSNDINRKWLDDMLHSWHCNVTLCSDAKAGMKAWQESVNRGRQFDTLIIDKHLEDVEAFEFVRGIQKQSQDMGITPPSTVLVMTSNIVEADIDACTELNINQQLIKPIKQSEVFNALMSALGKKTTANVNPNAISMVQQKLSLKVLVAEDHPVNQMLVQEVLENRGHHCHIVENGRLALESLESEHFDVVLMDVQMPIMDGITATKLIRKGTHQPSICIIGLTAKALKGDKNTCLDAGMNYYLTKPIKPKLLLEVLEDPEIRNYMKSNIDSNIDSNKIQNDQTQVELLNYQILNKERALLTTSDDVDLLKKILRLTKENIGPTLEEFKALYSQQDWLKLSLAVHKCKGMLANFCAEEFIDLMDQLIERAEQEDEQMIQPLVNVVIKKIEEFNAELTDFLEKSI